MWMSITIAIQFIDYVTIAAIIVILYFLCMNVQAVFCHSQSSTVTGGIPLKNFSNIRHVPIMKTVCIRGN